MKQLQHIMCVDDDEDILEITRLSLELGAGLTVTCCPSGRAALAQIAIVKPDLLLLDVMMPELDGPATYGELKKTSEYRSLPVIFLTARVQNSEMDEYLKLGAIGVLAKPFDPMTLFADIRKFWDAVPR